MHHLDIHIPDSTRTTSFIVRDASQYDAKLPVLDGWLEIYAPSSTQPMLWKVEKDFFVIVNSNLLHLTSGTLADLPDGTYYIKYSVKPNNQVYIQYALFRNTSLYNQYLLKAASVVSDKCRITNREYNEKVKSLNNIKFLIEAAKYMAENNHDLEAANMMYLDAQSKLNRVC